MVYAAACPTSFWQPHASEGTAVAVAAAVVGVVVVAGAAGMDIGEGGTRIGETTGAMAGV